MLRARFTSHTLLRVCLHARLMLVAQVFCYLSVFIVNPNRRSAKMTVTGMTMSAWRVAALIEFVVRYSSTQILRVSCDASPTAKGCKVFSVMLHSNSK